MTKYALYDTFGKRIISSHRTIRGAVRSKQKFNREFYRNNTASSYIPLELRIVNDSEVAEASEDEIEEFMRIECCE